MIKLIEPEKIDEHWSVIEHGISGNLGPLVKASNKQIKEALKNEAIFCFALLENEKENPLRGFVVAAISSDPLTDTFTLLIMCAYAVLEINSETWADAAVELIGWAKKRKCERIMTFSHNEKVIEFASRLGADTRYTVISLEV